MSVVERVSLWVFSGQLLRLLTPTVARRRLFRMWGLSVFYRPYSEAAYVLAASYIAASSLSPSLSWAPCSPAYARCTLVLHGEYTEASYR